MLYTKKEAREHFLCKRCELSDEALRENSKRLCDALCERDEFKEADTLLFFSSTRNEPILTWAIERALALGKSVAFPISLTDTLTLDFRTVCSTAQLQRGAYGIPEPSQDAPKATLTEHTLCIVPALAFDRQGYRLGYGKGYYDRFLKNFSGRSIGLVLDGFLCDSPLPTDATDISVDILITQTGAFNTK